MSQGSRLKYFSNNIRIILIAAAVILIAAIFYWWRNVHMNADNVFWGAMNNNLRTASVTRHVNQTAPDRSIDQFIRAQFGSLNAVSADVTLKQKTPDGESVVRSETIGTPDNDFSRYVSIKTPQKTAKGKPLDTSKVVGVWGKTDDAKPNQPAPAQYFKQSIVTIFPYADFNSQQRHDLISEMRDKKVYSYSKNGIKNTKLNNRPAYVYTVNIKPTAYIQLMQAYVRALGLNNIGLDPSTYANSPDLVAEVTIDKLSRQIVKISYPSTNQVEDVVDQNLEQPIILPKNTISVAELQARIQKITQ